MLSRATAPDRRIRLAETISHILSAVHDAVGLVMGCVQFVPFFDHITEKPLVDLPLAFRSHRSSAVRLLRLQPSHHAVRGE